MVDFTNTSSQPCATHVMYNMYMCMCVNTHGPRAAASRARGQRDPTWHASPLSHHAVGMPASPVACHSVLLIVADDMQPQDVGALRSTSPALVKAKRARHQPRSLRTPALDSLAEQGTVIARAYSPHAMCTPARTAILTGRLQSQNANVVLRARSRTGAYQSARRMPNGARTRLEEQHVICSSHVRASSAQLTPRTLLD